MPLTTFDSIPQTTITSNDLIDTPIYNKEVYDFSKKKTRKKYLQESAKFRNYYKNNNNLRILEGKQPTIHSQGGGRSDDPIGRGGNEYELKFKNRKQINDLSTSGASFSLKQDGFDKFGERFIQEQTEYLEIDSRDRDLALWPNANHYKITLPKAFTNISSMRIIASVIPNTQQLIKSSPSSAANNLIYWQNKDDLIAGPDFETYIATIPDGNYDADGLAEIIMQQMNNVKRITGDFHDFMIDINTETDLATFTQYEYEYLLNALEIKNINSAITEIEVTYTAHPFDIGDFFVIKDATSFGGLSASVINTSHIVSEVVDANTFKFEVSASASSLSTSSGTIGVGEGVDFSLLFSNNNTIASILGFQEIDTDFDFEHSNTKEIFKYTDGSGNGIRLKINEVEAYTEAIYSLIRTTNDHGLNTGDRIYLYSGEDLGDDETAVYDHLYGLDEIIDLTVGENDSRKSFVGELLNPAGHIVTRISANEFLVPVAYITIGAIETQKGLVITSSSIYGAIVLRNLNASITLAGETKVYLEIPGFENILVNQPDSILKDVFTIFQLSGTSNSVIFNSFTGNNKNFYNVPVANVTNLEFKFKTYDGELYDFNDQENSFIIELVQSIQKIDGQGYSSRIGSRT